MSDERYNGWATYETWVVALWIGNDQATSERWAELTAECWANAESNNTFSRLDHATFALADLLKDHIERGNPLQGEPSLYSEILSANLKEIDYHEIAANWLEDVGDNESEGDE